MSSVIHTRSNQGSPASEFTPLFRKDATGMLRFPVSFSLVSSRPLRRSREGPKYGGNVRYVLNIRKKGTDLFDSKIFEFTILNCSIYFNNRIIWYLSFDCAHRSCHSVRIALISVTGMKRDLRQFAGSVGEFSCQVWTVALIPAARAQNLRQSNDSKPNRNTIIFSRLRW
jgi:hypothetical protein